MNLTIKCFNLIILLFFTIGIVQAQVPNEIELLNKEGTLLDKEKQYAKANEKYLKVVDLLNNQHKKHPQYHLLLAKTYSKLMANYSPDGLLNLPKMFEYAEKVQVPLKSLPDAKDKSFILYQVAIAYAIQRNFKKATNILTKVITVAQNTNDTLLEIRTLGTLGRFQLNLSLYEEALNYFEKAKRMSQQLPNVSDAILTTVYANLGLASRLTDRYSLSIEYHQKQLDYTLKAFGESSFRTFAVYNHMINNYVALKKNKEARKYLDKMFEIEFPGKKRVMGGIYYQLGVILQLEDQHDKAVKAFKTSLDYQFKAYGKESGNNAGIYERMAVSLSKTKKFQAALESNHKALQINNPTLTSTSVESYPGFKGAAEIKEQIKALSEKGEIWKNWFLATGELTHLKKAYKASQTILAQLKEWKSTQADPNNLRIFIKHSQPVFSRIVDILLILYQKTQDQQYLYQAFQVAEQSKAYILLRSLFLTSNLNKDASSILEKNLEQQLKDLQEKLTAEQGKKQPNKKLIDQYQDDIFTLKTNQDSLQSAFKKYAPEYYKTRYQFQIASTKDIQTSLLKPEEALIEYQIGEGQLFIFIMTFQKLELKKVILPKDFQDKILAFRKSITDKNFSQFTQLGYELYQLLLKELSIPTSIQKLRIVPSGVLYYLPWEALLTQPTDKASKNYSSLPYLLQKYVISYDYSATLMLNKVRQQAQFDKENLLAFSPDFKAQLALNNQEQKRDQLRDDIAALKGAEAEVVALNKLYAGQLFMGKNATEYSFRNNLKNGSVIHLATHAIVDDERPAYSRLLFSLSTQDTLNDGYLHAYELYNLKLKAELVTLSACNTGFGKIQSGEGVLSLGRAFAYAGSPNVLMSLWSVPDQSTSQIMIEFYKNLASGMPKDIALQQAKLTYIESTDNMANNPFYWSSFVLIGDPKPLSLKPYTPFYLKSLFLWLVGLVLMGGVFFGIAQRYQ